MVFSGSIPALVTPMKADGVFDDATFQELVDWQISEGSHGLVPAGTTGESPTLSHAEHHRVVKSCVEAAAGRVPVIAGTGSNATAEAVALTRGAERDGADAVLVVTPYYNKPGQDGLVAHYSAIAGATGLPIIIYNIPGRSVVDMSVETMAYLARTHDNIVGVKDATNDLVRPLATRLACGETFCQLSGEDATVAAHLAQGGHGCISVSANVVPGLCAQMYTAWEAGDMVRFAALRDRLLPVHKAMFCHSSPAPAKYALSVMGRCRAVVRLPITELDAEKKAVVDAAIAAACAQ